MIILITATILTLTYAQQDNSVQNNPAPQSKTDSSAVAAFTAAPDQIPVSDTLRIPVLDFKKTDIRDILRAIGMQYNVNIYLEPDVVGDISLYLVDIAVKDAIDFIIRRKGYDYRIRNNIVRVFKPREEPPPPPPKPIVVFHVQDSLLSVDFKDVSINEVVRMFVDSTGINVVAEGQTNKTISCKLASIAVEKALFVIFESNGYEVTFSDGVYYVREIQWGNDSQSGTSAGSKGLRRMNIAVTPQHRVSIEVNNAPLDDLVRNIALESGIDIVIYDKITGSISAKCDSTALDDILRFLLQNTRFTFWKDKGIYFIGSREMSQQKTTEIIPLKHIQAEEAAIASFLPPRISKEAIIKYDNEHNAVIVIGSFDVVAEAKEFIERIDKPIPQVLIEALVVEFNINKIRSYGVSLFTGGLKDSTGNWQQEQFLPNLHLKPGRIRIARFLNYVLQHIGIDRVVTLPKNFKASIEALEAADIVKVHSTPQIATLNGNAASITIGETRYYKLSKETKSTTSNSNVNVIGTDERFVEKKFNTVLEVTPWVMSEGYVMVEIRPEFNIPRSGGDTDRPPTIDTRVIKSMVRLKNGQTIVLGGQRQTENVVNSKGVPLLSSIPILGYIFSSKTITKNETQMMIFLTPHVYYGDEGVVSPDDYFGDEINKMLEKYDPDMRDKLRDDKKKEREKKKNMRQSKRRAAKIRASKQKQAAAEKEIPDSVDMIQLLQHSAAAKDSTSSELTDTLENTEEPKKDNFFKRIWMRMKRKEKSEE